jgi:hypothetical protein
VVKERRVVAGRQAETEPVERCALVGRQVWHLQEAALTEEFKALLVLA